MVVFAWLWFFTLMKKITLTESAWSNNTSFLEKKLRYLRCQTVKAENNCSVCVGLKKITMPQTITGKAQTETCDCFAECKPGFLAAWWKWGWKGRKPAGLPLLCRGTKNKEMVLFSALWGFVSLLLKPGWWIHTEFECLTGSHNTFWKKTYTMSLCTMLYM